jgi:outer membrane PBP1 activator LpoA protein
MPHFLAFLLVLFGFAAAPGAMAAPAAKQETQPPSAAAQKEAQTPHIALLLPLHSPAFGRAAEAVQQGFMAAASVQAAELPVKIYPSGDQVEEVLTAYREALRSGARVIAGPLTKNAVTALAASRLVTAPTLALNTPEKDAEMPRQLYLFGLSAEAEARQIARLAFSEGRKSAAIVSSGTALAKRMQAAFAGEWQEMGGQIVAQLVFSGTEIHFPKLREAIADRSADMIFLAAEAQEARLVRPYLDPAVATYATSQIYGGKGEIQKNVDLNGILFVDMPWLLQPDHPAVMVYPRPAPALGVELERLYALGIDAWRLTRLLLESPPRPGTVLDGVTGQISMTEARQFTRELTRAEFRDGEAALPAAAQQ